MGVVFSHTVLCSVCGVCCCYLACAVGRKTHGLCTDKTSLFLSVLSQQELEASFSHKEEQSDLLKLWVSMLGPLGGRRRA